MNSDTRRPADDASAEGWMEADRQALRAAWPALGASAPLRTRLAAQMREQAGTMTSPGLWSLIGGWRLLGPSLAFGLLVGISAHALDPQPTASIDEWELLEAAQLGSPWQEIQD